MEGGISNTNLLDPGALEFYPSNQFNPVPTQIYYPYPLPPPPPPPLHPNIHLPHALPDDGELTRTVILSLIPPHVDEASVMSSMESFGPIRSLDSSSLTAHGSATVHFYDLRSAVSAVFEIRDQHVRHQALLGRQYGVVWPPDLPFSARGLVAGQAVWAQFGSRGADGPNQGSLFISNCDPSLPSAYLAQLFGSIGDVKEVKETAWKPQQRFIEFYDIRDAARAVNELNGKEVCGRRIVVEFTCTAGLAKRRSTGRQNRGFAQPPPRLVRSASAQTGSWVAAESAAAVASSSTERGGNRKIGKSGREDKKGKGRHEQTTTAQPGGAASSSSSSSSSVVAKQQQLNRRGWKNHSRNGGDSRFQFKENVAMEEGSSPTCIMDSRTTVMIKNIPNKYSQMLLLRMLDNHCIRCNEEIGESEEEAFSSYDFVYLPIDFNNKCNVGYGFVNLTSPEAAVRLHKAFHMQPWEVFNSRKICQVNYARLQGLEALKEHFKNSKFACDTDEYMPVVFCPPRDGKQLTEPLPVGGRGLMRRAVNMDRLSGCVGEAEGEQEPSDAGEASSTTASQNAPSDNGDAVDDDLDDDGGGDGDCDGDGDETGSRLSQALLHLSYSS